MATSLSIQSTNLAGKVRITPTVSNDVGLTLKNVSVMVNDNTSDNPFTESSIVFLKSDNTPLTYYDLSASILVLGAQTFIQFKYDYDTITVYSNVVKVVLMDVPKRPVLTLTSNIRAEDKYYAVNVGVTHNLNTIDDRYSPISKIIAYTSKVGGTEVTDFIRQEISITDYNNWYGVNVGALDNDIEYEVSVKYVNALGESQLSNTILVTPKNTPDQIAHVDAMPYLSFAQMKNNLIPGSFAEEDYRGDIVIRWSKPTDFNELIDNEVGVTKYLIQKQLMVIDPSNANSYIESGEPSIIELDVPYTSNSATVQEPSYASNDGNYDYKYTIQGSGSVDFGKAYKFSVAALNSNGLGPESNYTDNTFVFGNPDAQPYQLLHSNTVSTLTGAPLTVYDGKMSIMVDSLSNIQGAKDNSSSRVIPGASGLTDISGNTGLTAVSATMTDYTMYLTIADVNTPTSYIYDNTVTLKQQYEVRKTGTGTAVYYPLNKWILSFDDINSAVDINKTINEHFALNFGKKCFYKLRRISLDPTSPTYTFLSTETIIQRTSFKSPSKVSQIQAYSFNDDLTPAMYGAGNGLRLVFKQLTNEQMNGLSNFLGNKEYRPHKSSFPVGDIIYHNSTLNEDTEIEYMFNMNVEGIGQNGNLYLRVNIFNDELGIGIDGLESSPVVIGKTRSYPQAVSSLNVVSSSQEMTISWNKQNAFNQTQLGGFITDNIQNRVIVVEDSITQVLPVYNQHILWNAPLQSVTVSSLTNGKLYKIYVIAEGIYNADNINGVGKRFDNAIISNNLSSTSTLVTGTPTAPIVDGVFPSDKKVTFHYDPPVSLYGISAESLSYQFFVNEEDAADFPYYSTGVLQQPVATSTVTTFTIVDKVFKTKALSNNLSNLVNMANDTPYHFAMVAKADLANISLINNLYNYTYPVMIVNGVNKTQTLSLVTNSSVPSRTVYSAITSKSIIYTGDNTAKPIGLELTGAQSKVTVSIIKDTPPATHIDITVDKGDAGIASFNTKDVTYSKDGNTYEGLFALEQAAEAGALNTITPAGTYGSSGFNFRKQITNGITKYYIDFVNLTNGIVLNFDVRNARKVGDVLIYSDVVSGQAAAEAPPAIVQNSRFSVSDQTINLIWDVPQNSGGAGVSGNTPLRYKVQLLSSGGQILYTNTNLSQLSTSFTGLTNWTLGNGVTYSARITAYYNKANSQLVEGDYVTPYPMNNSNATTQKPSTDPSPYQIRVNAAPINGSGIFLPGANQITGTFTTATSTSNLALYPLTSYVILYKSNSGATVNETASITYPNSEAGITSANLFIANASKTITAISNLANGKEYKIIIRAVPSYSYAQGAPDVEYTVSPRGPLTITSVSLISGTDNKNYKVDFNYNGSGQVNSVIGLGKNSSSSIIVKNLTGASLPAITTSGTETSLLAANQLGSFTLSFAESSTSITDVLTVIGSQNSVDTYVFPTTGGFFT